MTRAISAAALQGVVNGSNQNQQEVLAVDSEAQRGKFKMRSLKEKLSSMVRVRRGFTVDSGVAAHMLPAFWLIWIILMVSAGFLRGLHYGCASAL